MLFSDLTFLFAFLFPLLVVYYAAPRAVRNFVLLIASLFFYTYGEAQYVAVMLVSIAANFGLGLGIDRSTVQKKRQRILIFGVVFNLSLLVGFKYANFIVDNFNSISAQAGGPAFGLGEIHLPIGISFFTFQAMSYLVDVYRSHAKVQRNPFSLGLYIAFFPQLIAGPIVRYEHVAEQISSRRESVSQFSYGIQRFIVGLGKKMVIANACALPVDQIFLLPDNEITTPLAWFAMICYAMQIYFDFSGYSDMAIGLGCMFGFRFCENFNYPYISQSVTEFWRRWHISLSSWFRDYLYIPLGGNRISSTRTYLNLFLVFVLCGFWHGASWNFLIWGIAHGMFLVLERFFRSTRVSGVWPRPVRHLYVCLIVLVTWIPFRATTISQSSAFFCGMFGFGNSTDLALRPVASYCTMEVVFAIVCGLIGATPIVPTLLQRLGEWKASGKWYGICVFDFFPQAALLTLFAYCTMLMSADSYSPFIYFRF